jgi:formyltetrahydrofolate synthetase
LLIIAAAATYAVLNQPASGNTASAEMKIVSRVKSLKMAKTAEEENQIKMELGSLQEELNNLLKELGVDDRRFTLSTGNSIESYFICDSVEQLKALRGHYESGLMKTVLERIFTLLAGETITIHELKWPAEEYNDRLRQLGQYIFRV